MPDIQDALDDSNAEILSEDVENYLLRFLEEYETSSYREEIREEDWKAYAADPLEEQ